MDKWPYITDTRAVYGICAYAVIFFIGETEGMVTFRNREGSGSPVHFARSVENFNVIYVEEEFVIVAF